MKRKALFWQRGAKKTETRLYSSVGLDEFQAPAAFSFSFLKKVKVRRGV